MPNFCTFANHRPQLSYSISNNIRHSSKWWVNNDCNFIMLYFSVQKLLTISLTIRSIIEEWSEQVILLVTLWSKELSLSWNRSQHYIHTCTYACTPHTHTTHTTHTYTNMHTPHTHGCNTDVHRHTLDFTCQIFMRTSIATCTSLLEDSIQNNDNIITMFTQLGLSKGNT